MKSIIKRLLSKFINKNSQEELQELLTKYYQEKIVKYIQSFNPKATINIDDYKEEIEYLVEKALNQDSEVWERIAERYYS